MGRARVEAVLGAIAMLLAIATAVWPSWIEGLTGLEPDGGSGEAEWLLVAGLVIVAIAAGLMARRDFRIAKGRPERA
jgi:hypothetical protein